LRCACVHLLRLVWLLVNNFQSSECVRINV
jgi:hypothetical protein